MTADDHCQRAVALFQAGRYAESLACIRQALAADDNSERWNDWATLEYITGHADEAEAGYRIALDLDCGNTQAALNLGALLQSQTRNEEAIPYLEQARTSEKQEEKAAAERLWEKFSVREPSRRISEQQLEHYLRKFLSEDPNERSYFETHIRRYVATLSALPNGDANQRLLELGAAFHHLTPALQKCKRYGEVRCNDIWQGAPHETRRIVSNDGEEEFSFVVDNFDVQKAPWPCEDKFFDVVLCCEMLEHLHTDPMGLFAEMHRVLKPQGVLLLTTPNLACAHAVEAALRGESPYVYGKFERAGSPTDRHNREYTAGEVERLARAAGFETIALRTIDSWWERRKELLRTLAAQGYPIARRGDNTLLLARKECAIRERYPEEFYQNVGTQAERRSAQKVSIGVELKKQLPAQHVPPKNILLIHEVLPHFDCSGSDLRLMDIIREIRRQGHHLTYVARNGKNVGRYAPPLQALGVKVIADDPDRMRHAGEDRATTWNFRELLERGRFHIAILFHWYWSGISVAEDYLQEIRHFSSETRIFVLTDDRHGERERRMAKLTGSFSDEERGNDFEAREIEVYQQADLVLYISEADRRRFLGLCPGLQTELLPMQAEEVPRESGFGERDGILFLGNFDNLANRDALHWMLESIWPLFIREEPGLTLFVAGNAAPKDLESKYPNMKTVGKVEDLGPLFAAHRVFAAPISYGTGINTKNLQALAHGLPIVTTSIGAEGLQLEDGVHALIADTPQSFATSLLRLYREPELWHAIAAGGKQMIATRFSREQFAEQIRKIIARAPELPPKSLASRHTWSYRAIENTNPEVLTQPAEYRALLRLLAYWQAGRKLLAAGNAREALAQFRHVFALQRGTLPATVFHARLLSNMAAAYRKLNDKSSARRCEEVSCRLVLPAGAALWQEAVANRSRKGSAEKAPQISVIIPTHNRKETLRLCLSALALQLLPAERWEIVVVDDGSTDGTDAFCRDYIHPNANLRFIRQHNLGAGAARRAGVEAARGEFVLLLNDDTIATSNLLTEHLRIHREKNREKLAVLGGFRPSAKCLHRPLSFWINHSSFLFPQNTLKPGLHRESAYFITCNLSIRRDSILNAGNFDPDFGVAEDTELGARLVPNGYGVFFHPEAGAFHEHAEFTVADLLHRARVYGQADWKLFQKHPQLLGDGAGPFGMLRESDFERMKTMIEKNREPVAIALDALSRMEQLEMAPLFQTRADGTTPAEELWQQLGKVVPMVYWHYLLESFLAARSKNCTTRPLSRKETSQLAAV